MDHDISILAFGGSLRKGSYNMALLRAAEEMVPSGARLEVFGIAGIPPFNQDLENSPAPIVREFKDKIRVADAILIATPEYNYSIPGYLKNAIDSASRPYHGCIGGDVGNGAGSIPLASELCLLEHAATEQTGGHGTICPRQDRRKWQGN
jgi:NAD(P)H-dependent FMN reductase